MAPGLREPGEQANQFQQVGGAKGGTPSRDGDKWIVGPKAGPARRNGLQPPLIVVKVGAILAPIMAERHQLELAAAERMKRMRHPEGSLPIDAIRCNRQRR